MINEHTIWGEIGKLSILLSFFMVLFSALVFGFSKMLKAEEDKKRFIRTGTIGYVMHLIALATSSAILIYLIFNHYFEYAYVWKYSSVLIAFKYTIACFWAGTRG